jgi:hypothetical protein
VQLAESPSAGGEILGREHGLPPVKDRGTIVRPRAAS